MKEGRAEMLLEHLFGSKEQQFRRGKLFQNIILDYWDSLPKSMQDAVENVWKQEDREHHEKWKEKSNES